MLLLNDNVPVCWYGGDIEGKHVLHQLVHLGVLLFTAYIKYYRLVTIGYYI